jgi:hypothetical protein
MKLEGVSTYMVDANYVQMVLLQNILVKYLTQMMSMLKKMGDVEIDRYAEEQLKTPYTAGEGI